MKHRPIQKKKTYDPIPSNLAELQDGMTQNFLQPAFLPGSADMSYYTVKPWPSAQTPAMAFGKMPPHDESFAQTNGAEGAFIGREFAPYQRHPVWQRQDMIDARKKLEWELTLHSPQSRLHDLNQFHSAFVSQPPQTLYSMPDYPPY